MTKLFRENAFLSGENMMILQQRSLHKVRVELEVSFPKDDAPAGRDFASIFKPLATRKLVEETVVIRPNIHCRRQASLKSLEASEHDEKVLNAFWARAAIFDPTARVEVISDPDCKVSVFRWQLELRNESGEKLRERNNNRHW